MAGQNSSGNDYGKGSVSGVTMGATAQSPYHQQQQHQQQHQQQGFGVQVQFDQQQQYGHQQTNAGTGGPWQRTMDASSGLPYWFHSQTQEVTWKDPYAGAHSHAPAPVPPPNVYVAPVPDIVPVVQAAVVPPPPADEEFLPPPPAEVVAPASPWLKTTDPTSGNPYWYHQVTKEVTWSDPESTSASAPIAAPVVAPEPMAPQNPWVEKENLSGNKYWLNSETNETSPIYPDWQPPAKEPVLTAPVVNFVEPPVPGAAAAPVAGPQSPWIEKKNLSGEVYWFNTETNEISNTFPNWTPPVVYTAAPSAARPAGVYVPEKSPWVEKKNLSGEVYWLNQDTQELSPAKPAIVLAQETAAAAAAAPADPVRNPWVEKKNLSGATYWLNEDTQEISDSDPILD